MWTVKGEKHDPPPFKHLKPLRILDYCDGPKVFTFDDDGGWLYLAVWSDSDENCERFLVTTVPSDTINDLDTRATTLHQILKAWPIWVVDVYNDERIEAWLTQLSDVPADAQPHPDH